MPQQAAMVVWRYHWTALVGLVFGLLMIGPLGHEAVSVFRAWRASLPVVAMRGELIEVGADSATLHIWGEKLRGEECRYLRISGFAVGADGFARDAVATRLDRVEDGHTKPAGRWDIGLWRIAPVGPGSVAVGAYVSHYCDGVAVATRIADVPLVQPAVEAR